MGFWGCVLFFFHFIHAGAFPVKITAGFLGAGIITLPCGFDSYQATCKIDTGVNITTIPLTTESAAFKSVGKVSHVAASGSIMSCDVIEVNAVSFNKEPVTGLHRVVRCPLPEDAKPIVGLDVLAQAPFGVIYSRPAIFLNETPKSDFGKKFVMKSDHILIDIDVKTVPSRAMFDTGAGVTYVSQQFYEKNPEMFYVIGGSELVKDTQGKMIGTQTAILARLDVGPKRFVGEYVLIMDFTGLQSFLGPDVEFVLGHNMLSQADWFFDTKNQKWDVE